MDENWHCKEHGETCLSIKHIEQEQVRQALRVEKLEDKIEQHSIDRRNEIKDCRKSFRIDCEKLESFTVANYVTKAESRVHYMLTVAIIMDGVRRLFA